MTSVDRRHLNLVAAACLAFCVACDGEGQATSDSGDSSSGTNCTALQTSGDATTANGANWSYASTDDGVAYSLTGKLFAPAGAGPFPAALVSHGAGGNAAGYSANVARVMRGWGMVVIATNYTHAGGNQGAGLPDGEFGASEANVLRAHKTRDLLACVSGVDMQRLAAHGHSMGAFVTGQLLGTHPADFRAASHSAGGANENGPNATRIAVAVNIRTPYLLHHGDNDMVVHIGLDQELERILTSNGVPHELVTWPSYTHEQIALDTAMLEQVRAWYRLHGVLPLAYGADRRAGGRQLGRGALRELPRRIADPDPGRLLAHELVVAIADVQRVVQTVGGDGEGCARGRDLAQRRAALPAETAAAHVGCLWRAGDDGIVPRCHPECGPLHDHERAGAGLAAIGAVTGSHDGWRTRQ